MYGVLVSVHRVGSGIRKVLVSEVTSILVVLRAHELSISEVTLLRDTHFACSTHTLRL